MIERLPGNSEAAVKVINCSSHGAQLTAEHARLPGRRLEHIAQSPPSLPGLNASIASATLQQSQVIGAISQNIAQAAGLAHSNALTAERSSDTGKLMGQLAEQLNRLLVQFRV